MRPGAEERATQRTVTRVGLPAYCAPGLTKRVPPLRARLSNAF